MTIAAIEKALEEARNEGRHEGIVTFFDQLEIALAHHKTIDGVQRWYESARAVYEEHRP